MEQLEILCVPGYLGQWNNLEFFFEYYISSYLLTWLNNSWSHTEVLNIYKLVLDLTIAHLSCPHRLPIPIITTVKKSKNVIQDPDQINLV